MRTEYCGQLRVRPTWGKAGDPLCGWVNRRRDSGQPDLYRDSDREGILCRCSSIRIVRTR